MKKRKASSKVDIVYNCDGVKINYVSRSLSELPDEYARIRKALVTTLRLLKTLRRSPHPAIAAAYFQISNCMHPVDTTKPEEVTRYIARVSYVMNDTLKNILSKLSNSNIDTLKQIRFQLEYGQTPKKREKDELILQQRNSYIERETFDDEGNSTS
jgi:hypothetical protein